MARRTRPPAAQGLQMLHELSLFTGGAMFSIGLKRAGINLRTVGYVENDPYAQKVIQARIQDGYLDNAPIWADVCAFDGGQYRGLVDVITAGFPCQPHSTAGQRLGAADERNLWPDTLRIISEVGPGVVVLENVPGLGAAPAYNVRSIEAIRQLSLFDQDYMEPDAGRIDRRDYKVGGLAFMGSIGGELSDIGYDCRWDLVPAAAVGAPHLRWRWWCLAYPKHDQPGVQ